MTQWYSLSCSSAAAIYVAFSPKEKQSWSRWFTPYIHSRSGSERKHPYPVGRPANPTATGVARLCYPYILLLGLSRDTHPCLLNTPALVPCPVVLAPSLIHFSCSSSPSTHPSRLLSPASSSFSILGPLQITSRLTRREKGVAAASS
jgi:hypothetical protein